MIGDLTECRSRCESPVIFCSSQTLKRFIKKKKKKCCHSSNSLQHLFWVPKAHSACTIVIHLNSFLLYCTSPDDSMFWKTSRCGIWAWKSTENKAEGLQWFLHPPSAESDHWESVDTASGAAAPVPPGPQGTTGKGEMYMHCPASPAFTLLLLVSDTNWFRTGNCRVSVWTFSSSWLFILCVGLYLRAWLQCPRKGLPVSRPAGISFFFIGREP